MIQRNDKDENLISFKNYFKHPWFTADLNSEKKLSDLGHDVQCDFDTINQELEGYLNREFYSPDEESIIPDQQVKENQQEEGEQELEIKKEEEK